MKRPRRTRISKDNLLYMGVPRGFHEDTIDCFRTHQDKGLEEVKKFFKEYLKNLQENFENNKGILLYGSNGVGKTKLSSLIVKEAYWNRYTASRVTFVVYIDAYTKIWSARSLDEKEQLEQEFYNRYKSVEFLVLDEVGKEVDSKISAPILEDCLRYREDKGLVTIICTNLPLSVLEERYGTSIISLMQGNMTPIMIEGVDKRKETFDNK